MSDMAAEYREAIQVLARGGVVAHPTDTVWGLAADASNPAAVAKVHAIKQSDPDKQLLSIIPTIAYADEIVELSDDARSLIEQFWPGGLALVVAAKAGGTIGLRYPDHDLSLQLARGLGRAITTTSANITGQATPTSATGIQKAFESTAHQPDLILDHGQPGGGQPSTIIDLSGAAPRLLRSGAVSVSAIERVLGRPLR